MAHDPLADRFRNTVFSVAYDNVALDAVRGIQARVNDADLDLAVDGHYGSKTQAAVRWFRLENDLRVDGVAGPQTWGELF